MSEFQSFNDVLDFAIANEIEAAQFYSDLAGKMTKPWMREVFESFAREEEGHRAKLEAVKAGAVVLMPQEKVADLKIAEYLVETQATADMEYQQALVVAMQKEKAAFRLYTDLAAQTEDENLRRIFQGLAQEEAKHKLRFEIEYDDMME